MWSIIVHGGAGAIRDSVADRHKAGCRRAIEAGSAVLARGGSSLDAVTAAVRVLEDDPTYNAGHGAALDERGLPAVDASVMRGSDLAYGAIGAVVGLKNPIDVARAVLEDGRHCLLVGPSALAFARRRGFPIVSPAELETDHARSEWARRQRELASGRSGAPADWMPEPDPAARADVPTADTAGAISGSEDGRPGPAEPGTVRPLGDTVGAVARDASGVVVAGTSTGGLSMRYAGRVGDSPIAGAGTYARDDLGGISATGHGETMMRTVLAYQALLALASRGATDPAAVLRVELDAATARTGGRGGLIAVLADGAVAWARNTAHMGVAWARAGESSIGTDF